MADEDIAYVRRVRSLPCLVAGWGSACLGPVQAHHAGDRGLGQRAHDHTCIPLCAGHHKAWHDAEPPFRGWNRVRRRTWAHRAISQVQAELGLEVTRPEPGPWRPRGAS